MCKRVCVNVFIPPTEWGREIHSTPHTGYFIVRLVGWDW